MRSILPAMFVVLLGVVSATRAADDQTVDQLKQTFLGGSDAKEREKVGIALALKDPDLFAGALDEVIKAKKPEDAALLARICVKLKIRHLRLLLVWAISQYAPEVALPALLDRIDNDYPDESKRAAECLGFLRNHDAMPRLMDMLRSQNELIGVQAARAVARVANKADAGALVDATVGVDNSHVRVHLVWALQDVLAGKAAAGKAIARYLGKAGTPGFRAKEATAVLEDGIAEPEEYKVKLDTIRTYFGKKGGPKPPPIDGPKAEVEKIQEALGELQKKSPAWYHLVCNTLTQIKVSGSPDIVDLKNGLLNLRFVDISKWNRSELFEYYIVRYSTIMFLGKMGDPWEKHRGWEEGMMEGWYYAMEHTMIDLSEDPLEFIRDALKNAPW